MAPVMARFRFRVLVSDPLHPEALGWLQAQPDVELSVQPDIPREALLEAIGAVDALIVRGRTRVDAAVLQRAERLKVVGRAGTGLDNIDVEAARARGVRVLNAPGANANAVAELTMGLMLALARHLPEAFQAREKLQHYGRELQGRTLGLIGLGQIGSRVARLALGFGMRVLGYDVLPEAGRDLPIERVPLDALKRESEVLSVHVPLTAETRGLIDAKFLRDVREGVWLVNTARADVVDEEALLEALEAGRVGGYAADVPGDKHQTLRGHPRVILTPHIGAQTEEAQRRAGLEIVQKVVAALRDAATAAPREGA